ncbi:MAG: MarR family transcriptional regulator [Bacteroidetes bacterium]|nr:MarR family transcriptional regulator [Bacteroidota bacterium]
MKQDDLLLLENQLCFPLYVASRLITKMYGPLLKELDLTYPQYLVLLALWEKDKQRVSDLSQRLFLESNTLTPLLKRLEQKEMIIRERSVSDERTVIIRLRKRGENLKEKAVCIPNRIIDTLSEDTTTENEIRAFKATLENMIGKLQMA